MSALPPVVVSGLPNITPIFMRIWLMKMTMQLVRLMVAVSLRSAWLHQAGLQARQESPSRLRDFGLGTSARPSRYDQVDRAQRTSVR